MGKKVIVSIISEHNLPNISLIRNTMADTYLDILTEKSKKEFYESYLNAVTDEKTSFISDRFQSIIVDESNPENIINELSIKSSLFDEAETIFVNITCGTKLLSLYTYIFFKETYSNKSKFYYMNISSSSNTFIDLDTKEKVEMKSVLSLKQYLRSYDYIISPEAKESFSYETADTILKDFTGDEYISVRTSLNDLLQLLKDKYLKHNGSKKQELYNSFNVKNIISELQDKYGTKQKDKIKIASIVNNQNNICQFLDNIADKVNNSNFRHSDNMDIKTLRYIISEFLEEYIYYIIKNEIFIKSNKENLIHENIMHSIKISKTNNNNNNTDAELDVLFSYNNILCYIECKTGASNDIIKESTFKQRAVSSLLSISSYNVFIILNEYNNEKKLNDFKMLKDKAKKFKVKLITKKELLDGSFIDSLKKHCKIF